MMFRAEKELNDTVNAATSLHMCEIPLIDFDASKPLRKTLPKLMQSLVAFIENVNPL
jgi:hypothetical protein